MTRPTTPAKIKSYNDLSTSDLYSQNWEHVRHVENERLGFTSVYFIIIAATIAFLAEAQPSQGFTVALLVLLSTISLVGALMSFRLKADLEAHGERLRRIARESRFPAYFTFGAEEGWTTRIKLRDLFPALYTLLAIVLFGLAVATLIEPDLLEVSDRATHQPPP